MHCVYDFGTATLKHQRGFHRAQNLTCSVWCAFQGYLCIKHLRLNNYEALCQPPLGTQNAELACALHGLCQHGDGGLRERMGHLLG